MNTNEEGVQPPPRPVEEMWSDLEALVEREARNPWVRSLLTRVLASHGDRLRIWPAALMVHHAYPGGLLEHVLKVAEVGVSLARTYGADADVVLAGALLHDLGKLEELDSSTMTRYTTAGNLLGHIALGTRLLRAEASRIDGFPEALAIQIEHLVLSHHGSRAFGSPVEPMTVEAFILAAVDDLDAKIHQVRRHVAEDESEGDFTCYHPRLKRVLFKPSGR
jgi:3'-5' exoribonuclease